MNNQNRAGALEDELHDLDQHVIGHVRALLFIAQILIAILKTLEEMGEREQ